MTLVVLYGQTRILFAIGRDGLLPERFAKVSPRTHTPVFNTIVVATIVGLLAGFIPLSSLWDLVSIGTLVAFIVVALAVIVLRVREPDLERGFKVPGYPVTPILSIAACIYILTGLHWTTYAWFLGWLAVVLTFYFLWSRHHSHLSPRSLGALVAGAGTLTRSGYTFGGWNTADDGSGTGTKDGGVTIDDLLYYLVRFEAGC